MQKTASTRSGGRRRRDTDADTAQIVANEYCLLHYAVGYTGDVPQRLLLQKREVWIVPVVFTSAGYGTVGAVGVVAVDTATRTVLGATPRDEVLAGGARLSEEKRDELDAAFRRARTT